jgi:hypothetical protein
MKDDNCQAISELLQKILGRKSYKDADYAMLIYVNSVTRRSDRGPCSKLGALRLLVISSPKTKARPAHRASSAFREATERESSTLRSITDRHDDRSAERDEAIPENEANKRAGIERPDTDDIRDPSPQRANGSGAFN